MSMEHEVYKAFLTIPKEFRDRGNDCMYQLQEAAKAFDVFATQAAQEGVQRREEEREEALLACKQQDELIEEIDKKITRAQLFADSANSGMRAAELALRAARDAKPTRFPLRAEITAWEQSVAMATEAFDKAQDKFQRKNGIVESFRIELRQAKDKLQELEAKEFALRSREEQQELTRKGLGPLSRDLGFVGERVMGR